MEFVYYGANCVFINGKNVKILFDPVTGEYGPEPKAKADVLLFSQAPKEGLETSGAFVIDSPGEYEIKGTTIDAIPAQLHTQEDKNIQEGVMYVVRHKNMSVLLLGNIAPELSEEQVERIDGVDIVVLPVGGKGLTLDKVAAASLLRQFEPLYVVPTHYDDGQTEYPVPQDSVDGFMQELGVTDVEESENLKVTSVDRSEETKFVVLKVKK